MAGEVRLPEYILYDIASYQERQDEFRKQYVNSTAFWPVSNHLKGYL
ncbi:hypothetical protein AALA54_12740 [Oscillospiraceae bacterium 44-34]